MRAFSAYGWRKTHAVFTDRICATLQQHKAWSQNTGYEHPAATVTAYVSLPREQQREIIRGLANSDTW